MVTKKICSAFREAGTVQGRSNTLISGLLNPTLDPVPEVKRKSDFQTYFLGKSASHAIKYSTVVF